MFIVILIVDQFLFRPLVAWSYKFKTHFAVNEEEKESWLLNIFNKTKLIRYIGDKISTLFDNLITKASTTYKQKNNKRTKRRYVKQTKYLKYLVFILSILTTFFVLWVAIDYLLSTHELITLTKSSLATTARVLCAVFISSILWIPVGVFIGSRPRVSSIAQPIAQILSAFPMNLIFPVAVWCIAKFSLNLNIWAAPLTVLGAQWYILFNVIAGMSMIPRELYFSIKTINLRGILWWTKFILPAIFPYYLTGAITAAGAAWNVSIIAEALTWGKTTFFATGLGAYIVKASESGNIKHVSLGIIFMSLCVLILNKCLWEPLYKIAENKFQIK